VKVTIPDIGKLSFAEDNMAVSFSVVLPTLPLLGLALVVIFVGVEMITGSSVAPLAELV
jgi:hypothetical protein